LNTGNFLPELELARYDIHACIDSLSLCFKNYVSFTGDEIAWLPAQYLILQGFVQ